MKKKTIIILILILVIALAASGCVKQKISEKLAENLVEKIAEKAGSDIDVDIDKDGVSISGEDGELSISGGDNLSWPKDAPANIPEFKGNIFSSIVNGKSFAVGVNEVDLDEFGAYVAIIEGKGYESGDNLESDGLFIKQYTLGSTKLTLTYTEDSETLMISAEWE